MLLNCDAGEDSCESLGLQGDPTSPSVSLEQVENRRARVDEVVVALHGHTCLP